TGNVLWEHGTQGPVFPAVTYVNGMLLVGAGHILEVLDATNGNRLYTYQTGGEIYSAPQVWNGNGYVGSSDPDREALKLVNPPAPPAEANCPAGFTCQDIGNNVAAGSETIANGVWTVKAGGTQVHGKADSFRFLSEPVAGDAQISAKILTESTQGVTPQAGIM